MKRLVLMVIPVFICGMVLTSCGSNNAELASDEMEKKVVGSEIEIEGTYSGTYSKTNLSPHSSFGSGTISIELKNGNYACIGTPHSKANISGTYSINDDKIIFEINVWETNDIDENGNGVVYDFDIDLIPQGEHSYTFDGKKLVLSKVIEGFAHYEHNLDKK